MSQQINLFNPAFLKQEKYFSASAMLQSLLLIAFGSALFYGYAAYQVSELGKLSDETAKLYAAEQLKLTRHMTEFSPQQAGQQLAEELKKAEAQLIAQQEIIEIMKTGVLGNTNGYSEYMRAFARQVVNGLWLTGFQITGDAAQISMNGGALSPELVPSYLQKLGQEKIMQGKTVASLQLRQPKAENGKVARHIEFSLQSYEGEGASK